MIIINLSTVLKTTFLVITILAFVQIVFEYVVKNLLSKKSNNNEEEEEEYKDFFENY